MLNIEFKKFVFNVHAYISLKVHQDLIALQKNVVLQQPIIDQLVEDKHNTRRLTEKSRHHLPRTSHHDLDRLDSDVNRITTRWNNVCSQLVDRYNIFILLIIK